MEHATLVTLNQWNVASVAVGSKFIGPLPCRAQDKTFVCGGFTEYKLSGKEIYWAAYQDALVDSQPSAAACTAPDYRNKVEKAYRTISLNGLVLHDLVHGQSEDWREELSGDVTSMGQVFEIQRKAVIDLQVFVAADGNLSVFDPQGLNGDKKFSTCWSQALHFRRSHRQGWMRGQGVRRAGSGSTGRRPGWVMPWGASCASPPLRWARIRPICAIVAATKGQWPRQPELYG